MKDIPSKNVLSGKFQDRFTTRDGSDRASVALTNPTTLWFNTGTLCNITCAHCYIESSPTNDALIYLTPDEVRDYLDQIAERNWPVEEIGFTGGEPFMNPGIIDMLELSLMRGFRVLVLTNAMQPMMRPRMKAGLSDLENRFPGQMTLRISVDHYSAACHDAERGAGSFQRTLEGMRWLRDAGIRMAVAGRMKWGDNDADTRRGFGDLYHRNGFAIDAANPGETVLFPEMDETADVPEITTACWGILNKSPTAVMCASSRMVVRRKGADRPAVIACTLLPYEPEFELGGSLAEAERDVQLNHPHCAKFCVLGGASCSA